MTRRRWIADEFSGDRAALLGQNSAHLARVLRAKPGQEFDIACGELVRRGRITAVTEERVEFALGDEVAQSRVADIRLLLSVFKFDRMEWAIEKVTELGVARIVPVIARRTDAHLVSAAAKRMDRWRRLVREAAQQSRRSGVPEIAEPMMLRNALSVGVTEGMKIVLAESEADRTLAQAMAAGGTVVTLAIGPEGGWTDEEMSLFRETGWTSASLGQTILRAETAVIAAVAIVSERMTERESG
ncbi:MAG TPA: RsmE family RNA methyltransferase [Terriglobales bacterium]|nr:RsmE family RNA methyltransferase [Terriglobales bacterium]